ncbi:transcription factor CP2-like protein 1 isoform X2 [Centruroides vittatus]|uniref:transcription factor CP2-like protein 1 isoform X2 n=1 Tax=Centruroides vittatus TaxID=120091 RepID=UPI00350F5368
MTNTHHWHVDDIDDALAADFDGSLSGLGMELGTASFNMSDALMALPNLSALKQENSRENGDTSHGSDCRLQCEPSRPVAVVHGKKNRLSHGIEDDVSSAIKRFCVSNDKEDTDSSPTSSYYSGKCLLPQLSVSCEAAVTTTTTTHTTDTANRCRHSSSVPDLRVAATQNTLNNTTVNTSMLSQILQLSPSPPTLSIRDCSPSLIKTSGFQYVLGAATSLATKIDEETMTYLNEGQSYEIKLKKLGDLTEMRGKMLKSVVKVGFQDRKLQYMEKDLISQWQSQRAGERIMDIDIPLSYGIYEAVSDSQNCNRCEFLWDPTKETGVFIRVNCISTEFTPKKHGGEKGVPFRIQIETFSYGDGASVRLHVASCQVKVFKPKGADRKHKTDREKMSKRPQSEQEKYQPSYDCTVLKEAAPLDTLYLSSPPPPSTTTVVTSVTTPSTLSVTQSTIGDTQTVTVQAEQKPSTPASSTSEVQEYLEVLIQSPSQVLSSEANSAETAQWLQQHRFGTFVRTFSNFSGADILRLSRDDLIQICGLADGIRLFNALHSRAIRPRLTMYVCLSTEQVFRAVYLENLTVSDLSTKLGSLFRIPTHYIHEIYINGPSGIHILVNDEVIQNIPEESMYTIEMLMEKSSELCRILFKPYSQH